MANTKELRKQYKLTQKELADRIGVSLRTVQNWDYRNNLSDWILFLLFKIAQLESW